MTTAITPGAEALYPPFGAYSHVQRAPAGADLFYISGQVGVRIDGTTPPTLLEQTDQAFLNVAAILKANGMGFEHVVKMNTYIVAGGSLAEVREGRAKHLGDARPCSTAVFVAALAAPEWLIEIEAIAAKERT